jgi:acylphosphatase
MYHIERLHAIVIGRVQGVGYRYFVQRHAVLLSLTGWVRNLPEGNVEITAEGSSEAIDKLCGLLSLGPAGAIVIEVKQDRNEGSGEFNEFRIETRETY